MKAVLFVSQSPTGSTPALDLIQAFLSYQGVAVERRGVLPQDVAKATRGASMDFWLEFKNLHFCEPMALISYFQREGLCRL